ncbi:chitin-inducible gibberellin-responsive protein 1-like isoform X3 [Ananas comosus]|uniref:Chitin-inducible gibberellin-responsive protein 1-like isoform X3 n=1 Tax=Ananas comosus TaxID=4615 RepID=A0A6P5FIP8_ANACO|nr:chitin-inducible gibberellin-responsive protein 1-like isoform X3 [Ananas comosus]
MDLHQLLKYGLTASDHSCEFPAPRTPAYSDCSISKQRSPIESLSGNIHSQHSPLEPGSSLRQFQIKFSEFTEPNSQNTITSQNMRHALQELETVLMAPDTDEGATSTNPNTDEHKPAKVARQLSRTWSHESRREPIIMVQPQFTSNRYPVQSFEVRPEKRPREMKEDPQNKVKQLLIKCAEALSENKIEEFDALVQEAHGMVSISGEPIQRLGAYLIEGLVARKESSGTNIYRALKCREPESTELLSYMRTLYDICPYFKFGYMAANGAIAEALRSEDRIHIIDFQIAQGTQWITLIQALAARPGGPPHVRITGIDDPLSEYARGDGLQLVGKMLSDMSKKFNIPLEFTGLPVYCPQVTREMLDIRPGEALAVNFTLHLHHTPDESVDVSNPRDGLLRMVKGLSPKVTTLVEQESNTNTTPFLTRFLETLDYYYAMFESIDVTLPRDSKERISVEQHCLAKDIVNIIACEGDGRVERHELLGKWRSRLTMAGFKPYPLSSYVNSVIKKLLGFYSDKYTLVEKDGAMLLGWKNRSLISASAWH